MPLPDYQKLFNPSAAITNPPATPNKPSINFDWRTFHFGQEAADKLSTTAPATWPWTTSVPKPIQVLGKATAKPVAKPVQKPSAKPVTPSIVPKVNASQGLFDTYMADPSISKQGKAKLLTQLQNWEITEDDANQIITQIYKDKPQAPKEDIFKNDLQLPMAPTVPYTEMGDKYNPKAFLKNVWATAVNVPSSIYNIAAWTANQIGTVIQHPIEWPKKLLGEAVSWVVDPVKKTVEDYKSQWALGWTSSLLERTSKFATENPAASILVWKAASNPKQVLQWVKDTAKTVKNVVKNPIQTLWTVAKETKQALKAGYQWPKLNWQKFAETLSTKANRFNALDEQKFTEMTGETPWEFAVKRGMNKTGQEAVNKSVENWQESMKQADDAFQSIDGQFRFTWKGKDYLNEMANDLKNRLKNTESPKADRIARLSAKYDIEGLSMPEINELKREYARNFKYTWEQRTSESAQRSTNLQNYVREWQAKTAWENGLTNIHDINKNTQGWKAYADNLAKKLSRSQANNPVSLTDWVALSWWNPENLALFLGKKAFESKFVKEIGIKTFGKQEKPSIITADKESILKSNVQKKYDSDSLVPSRSDGSNPSLVRKEKPLQLKWPSWKPTIKGQDFGDKWPTTWPSVINPKPLKGWPEWTLDKDTEARYWKTGNEFWKSKTQPLFKSIKDIKFWGENPDILQQELSKKKLAEEKTMQDSTKLTRKTNETPKVNKSDADTTAATHQRLIEANKDVLEKGKKLDLWDWKYAVKDPLTGKISIRDKSEFNKKWGFVWQQEFVKAKDPFDIEWPTSTFLEDPYLKSLAKGKEGDKFLEIDLVKNKDTIMKNASKVYQLIWPTMWAKIMLDIFWTNPFAEDKKKGKRKK